MSRLPKEKCFNEWVVTSTMSYLENHSVMGYRAKSNLEDTETDSDFQRQIYDQ